MVKETFGLKTWVIMMSKKLLKRLKKRQAGLKRKREKWKAGESAMPKMPAITTRGSIRALRGGLPGTRG